jgi:tRNA (guanine-N7-)-methyltransferase
MTRSQARALDTLWPRFGLDFQDQPIKIERIFGRRAPLTLEIGFGNGEALAAMAKAEPEHDFIGVEVHRPGVGRLLNVLDAEQLMNVRIISHDAVEVVRAMLPAASLDRTLIYFPDPWPKKRHHKRRLIQPAFLAELGRAIRPGGRLELATDWDEYALAMLAALDESAWFVNRARSGGFAKRPPRRPGTRFERRGIERGHGVFDLVFERV